MAFASQVKNKVLTGQAREIIYSVLEFSQSEACAKEPIIDFVKVQQRVAAATGVSLRTIKRIKKEAKNIEEGLDTSFSTPNKKRKVQSRISLDDLGQCGLRRKIHDLYVTDRKVPTLRRIYQKMCEDYDYQGSIESLRKEMHNIGFRWKKYKNNRSILMEKFNIRLQRIEFIKKMKMYREENRPIIYMGETSIHLSHTPETIWSYESVMDLQKSKDSRLIIFHAGGEDGFVPGAYVRWTANCKTEDHNSKMNHDNYEKWLKSNLSPNLPPNSVIVIKNTPYQNKQIEKCPNEYSKKDDMKKWLTLRNIPFPRDAYKPELYSIIKIHKPKYKIYEIDRIINNMGHDVLRLPPYHADLNSIELVWKAMKEYVCPKNTTLTLQSASKYCDEFFEQFTENQWQSICERVKSFELDYLSGEVIIDSVIDEMITNLGEVDFSSDYEDTDSTDDEMSDFDEGSTEVAPELN